MMKKLFAICGIIITIGVKSQNIESINSSVKDLFLTNQITQQSIDNLDSHSIICLSELFLSLDRLAENFHNEASIILVSNGTNIGKLKTNATGEVFFVVGTRQTPINAEAIKMIKEASEMTQSDINPVFEDALYKFPVETSMKIYKVSQKGGEYLSDISKKLHVTYSDLKLDYYTGRDQSAPVVEWKSGVQKIKKGTKFKYIDMANNAFTYKWFKDFEGDGITLPDFKGINEPVRQGEDISIATVYYSPDFPVNYKMTIYDNETGQLMYERHFVGMSGRRYINEKVSSEGLTSGSYICSIELLREGKDPLYYNLPVEIVNP